jgi:hypothetical protein
MFFVTFHERPDRVFILVSAARVVSFSDTVFVQVDDFDFSSSRRSTSARRCLIGMRLMEDPVRRSIKAEA